MVAYDSGIPVYGFLLIIIPLLDTGLVFCMCSHYEYVHPEPRLYMLNASERGISDATALRERL
jgi:hypothetical protein